MLDLVLSRGPTRLPVPFAGWQPEREREREKPPRSNSPVPPSTHCFLSSQCFCSFSSELRFLFRQLPLYSERWAKRTTVYALTDKLATFSLVKKIYPPPPKKCNSVKGAAFDSKTIVSQYSIVFALIKHIWQYLSKKRDIFPKIFLLAKHPSEPLMVTLF